MSRKRMLVAVALAVGATPSSAFADKLSDFKDADRHDEGCVTIPVTYSSERSSCTSEGPRVHVQRAD